MSLSTLKSVNHVAGLITSEQVALDLFFAEGVIAPIRKCKKCGRDMVLRKRKETFEGKQIEGLLNGGIRKGSWLDKTRISLKDAILTIVLWINRYSSTMIRNETKLNPGTVVDFRNYLRNACTEIRETYVKLGGPNSVIQIDEYAVHSRKYGRGEADRELTWILGAIETGSRKCFVQIVPNRSMSTMIPILRRWISPDSTVWTDSHKSYSSLNKYFRHHETVNHSIEFTKVGPDGTIIHTNSIESLWKRLKTPLKEMNGTSEALLPSYLDELVVREHEADGFAGAIWNYIKNFK
ncbi:hypothetical protein GCK72_017388 [Caenorhabditis remanei]|uniref:ISXO2-like transposase domain-containing protein n=1 Tax=Caenorhabditis remanei TaxID=31234 RepID=A0A6A5G759_CAERE|nr:hypothetical protein GCK72_017388 [Caenorhabditis remanei]KAF1750837.1 hypothetical protein GCK72_017388 [Caenorhabditis remanei]